MLQACSRRVFRCFKAFERSFDAITSTIGPFFVVLCTALLCLGVLTYFEVYFPAIFLAGRHQSWLWTILGTVWSTYLIASFAFHYYHAVTILPGSPHDPPDTIRTRVFFTFQARGRGSVLSSARDVQARRAFDTSNLAQDGRICKKCSAINSNGNQPVKPERAHHCSVCKTCWLKFDHHCPWINGCVGLHNERYFLLFMIHTCLACTSLIFLGFQTMLTSLHFHENWNYWTPRAFTMLVWVLSVAMGFALGIMSLWQLWLIANGESTVEAHDNEYYRKLCKQRNTLFSNSYDLGRVENLREFFNVGHGRYPFWTILAPMRILPASDGFTWRKRHNWQQLSVSVADELTDDEGSGPE